MKIFKGLKENEFNAFLHFIKQWYCKNDDTGLFDKTNRGKLIKSIINDFVPNNVNNSKDTPEYLYRSYSFKTKEDFANFINKIIPGKTILSHPYKDYESWTSDIKIAEKYLPHGDSMIDSTKENEHGIMLKISKDDFKDAIVFSTEYVFNDKIEKNKFLPFVFKYLSRKLLDKIKDSKPVENDIEELQFLIPGVVRSITESEYILSEMHNVSPIIIRRITTKGNPSTIQENEEVLGALGGLGAIALGTKLTNRVNKVRRASNINDIRKERSKLPDKPVLNNSEINIVNNYDKEKLDAWKEDNSKKKVTPLYPIHDELLSNDNRPKR